MNYKKIIKYMSVPFITFMLLISVNGASVKPGSNFSVTLRCGNVDGNVKVTSSNASIVSGQINWCDRGGSTNVTAKAQNPGTASVSLVGIDATDANTFADFSGKTIDSVSVTVVSNTSSENPTPAPKPQQQPQTETKPEEKKSNDATLASLSVDKGELSPAFSASVMEYSVVLNDDSTEITFSAKANHSKAKVENATTQPLKVGTNSFAIDVTAEDGSKKSYIVNVVVNEVPKVFVDSEDQMGVLNNLEGVNIPKGFSETKVTINGQEVVGLVNEDGSTTLLYLTNSEGVKNFYVYDSSSNSYSLMEPIQLCGLELATVEIPEALQTKEGMVFQDITIEEKTYRGWKFNDENMQDYSLLYLMDTSGNIHYYMHYLPNNSLQVYDHLAPLTLDHLETMTSELSLYRNIAYGLGGLACVLGISLVIVLVKGKKHKSNNSENNDSCDTNNHDDDDDQVTPIEIEEPILEKQPITEEENESPGDLLSGLPEGAAMIVQGEEDDFIKDVTKNLNEILNSDKDNV